MTNIRYTRHALGRRRERAIDDEDVRRALETYDYTESLGLKADPGKSRIVGAPVDGYRLHVIIRGDLPPGRDVLVVTAYWQREGEQR